MPHSQTQSTAPFVWDCELAREFDLAQIATESSVQGIVFRSRTDSTNDLTLQLACDHALPTPLLVLTEDQTNGRGRGTNQWWSASGALTFSLLLDCDAIAKRPEYWPRISLATAVAVCETIETSVPDIPCGIRWPNDVLLAGRKVCGILPELPAGDAVVAARFNHSVLGHSVDDAKEQIGHGRTPTQSRFVLGVGVNVNNSFAAAPRDLQASGISLVDASGRRHNATEFLVQLLHRISCALDDLFCEDRQISHSWSRRCCLRGRTVGLDAGPVRVRGLCRGIDLDGALVILTGQGPQRFFGGRIEHTV